MLDQIINELSKHLPAETLLRYDDMVVPGEFLYLANYVDEKGNKPVKDQFYKIKVPVLRKNKHIQRMRLAYLQGGVQALHNYLNKYFDSRKAADMKRALISIVTGKPFDVSHIEEKLKAA